MWRAGTILRKVVKLSHSPQMSEGVGATVRRGIGRPGLEQLDPFLLLDEASVKKPHGFPDHPHRGFETVTYVLSGAVEHEDFLGNKGVIKKGDLQWMTAGKGIVHSEMPHGNEEAWVLQLWVNLKGSEKMCTPKYQELSAAEIPKVNKDGVEVVVLAGECMGTKAAVTTHTPITYLDVVMKPNTIHQQPFPSDWSIYVYVIKGNAIFSGTKAKEHDSVIFKQDEGDFIHVENSSAGDCRFLFIAGQPINEPIVRKGPFVLTTKEELQKTFNDYRHNKNGFENAADWRGSTSK